VNNVGKTPAFDVKGSYGFIVIRKEEQEPDYATWDKGEKGRLSVTPTFSFNLIMPNKPSAFFAQALGQTRIDTDHIEPAAARVPAEGGEYRVETMRFTEDIMESFRGRKAAFLCFGKLTYRDQFGDQHWKTFCLADPPPNPDELGFFPKCAQYNAMDYQK
jgi:hypothetical protein